MLPTLVPFVLLSSYLLRFQMSIGFSEVNDVPSFGIFYLDICPVTEQQADERAFAFTRGDVQWRLTLVAIGAAATIGIRASRQQQLSAVHTVVHDRVVQGTGMG